MACCGMVVVGIVYGMLLCMAGAVTTAGAIMPANVAMGMSRQEFYVFVDKMMRMSRKFNDYTFPHTSLVAGKHYTRIVQDYTTDWQVEDLWLPFAAVATSRIACFSAPLLKVIAWIVMPSVAAFLAACTGWLPSL